MVNDGGFTMDFNGWPKPYRVLPRLGSPPKCRYLPSVVGTLVMTLVNLLGGYHSAVNDRDVYW